MEFFIKKNSTSKNYRESKLLMLNSEKSKKTLNWKTKCNLNQSIKLISDPVDTAYRLLKIAETITK